MRVYSLAAAVISLALARADKSISIPQNVPAGAGHVVDPSFTAFAFEVSSFYNHSFDANGNANKFVQNLIQGVLDRTGGTPILRVGGTSGDLGSYDATLKIPASRPATEGGPAFDPPYQRLGPSWFNAFKNFPGAKFVFMVPLRQDNVANTIEYARKGLAIIGNRLDALEIGNEPDFYPKFGIKMYVDRFVKFEKALVKAFPALDKKIFQGIEKGWDPPVSLPVSEAFAKGMNAGGRIKSVAYHYYQHSTGQIQPGQLQSHVANHTRTVLQMGQLRPNIAWLNANNPNINFLMDEVGASMDTTGNFNNLATALWHVDYFLYCMSIGVDRIHMQQIVAPGFNMWEPVASRWGPPVVRANYYSQPFIGDFISRTPPRVANIPISGSDVLSAYGGFVGGVLTKIVFVNMNLWHGSGTRPTGKFNLAGLPSDVKSAKIHYLTAPTGADANSTLTYKGMRWTYGSGGLGFKVLNDSLIVNVTGGKLAVPVDATSAALVELFR